MQSRILWQEGRDCYAGYMGNILDHLGLSHKVWSPDDWLQNLPSGVTVVLGASDDEHWSALCTAYCERGNGLLAVGDVYGLENVLGVSASGRIREGWVRWEGEFPASDLRSSFHFFDAVRTEATDEPVESWGSLIQRNGLVTEHPAAVLRALGTGCAALLPVNLMHTFCMLQQGVPVIRDGFPAPDGTAAIDDEMLKTDDASVLDWERDREAVGTDGVPFFLHPIVDEWRIVFAKLVHRLLKQTDTPYVQRWFWPEGLPAVGHISHDTDGNSPRHARKLLERLKEAEIQSTWCVIMPGYEPDLNRSIVDEGHEIALHYNAMSSEIAQSHWSEEHFRYQLDRLKQQFPDRSILSNKNHYLRWEGDVQFYQWCERAGIRVEQSRGGTKQGNKGFLAGTCHPFRPIGKANEQNRLFELLSLPVLSWDPPMGIRCTAAEAHALLDRAIEVNGVAHFLFHPQMLIKDNDEVGSMLVELATEGKNQGIQWWTSEKIWLWLQQRNQVAAELVRTGTGMRAVISSEVAIEGLTLLLPEDLQSKTISALENAVQVRSFRPILRFGCKSAELQLDIQAGKTVLLLA